MVIDFVQLNKALSILPKLEERVNTLTNLLLAKQETQQKEETEKLLNVSETATFLNLSTSTIYTKVSKGELPVMKMDNSKRLYFSSTELLEYVKQGRKKTNDEVEAEAMAYVNNNKKGFKAC